MRRRFAAYYFILCVLGGPAVAQAATVEDLKQLMTAARANIDVFCPPVNQKTELSAAEADAHVNAGLNGLLKRLASANVGVEGKVREETSSGVLQRDLADVIKHNEECRQKIIVALFAAFSQQPVPAIAPDKTVQPIRVSQPFASRASGSKVAKPGPILRVFLKNNLTKYDLSLLARSLPNYDVRLGRSDVAPQYPADTLFVNRNKIKPIEVIAVLSALSQLGVQIKSVQQDSLDNRREIQVGTIASDTPGVTMLSDRMPVDPTRLSILSGPAFWAAAVNGEPWCPAGNHTSSLCHLDSEAHFVADK